MKKLLSCFFLAAACLLYHPASAQVKVNLSVNIGSQPVWGPPGYDHAEFYYLPEYDVYYDVPHRRYIYWEGNKRISAAALPPRFHNVDLYKTYKVVLNEPKPYLHHSDHLKQYAQYRDRHDQPVIRDSHEEKYWQIKDHPEHSKWKGHDNRPGHH